MVEVYLAASLLAWKPPHWGYKQQKRLAGLQDLVDAFMAKASWLDLGPHEGLCRSSDDAFDAVVAAITAGAAVRGQVERIPDRDRAVAAVEGWIALPAGRGRAETWQ